MRLIACLETQNKNPFERTFAWTRRRGLMTSLPQLAHLSLNGLDIECFSLEVVMLSTFQAIGLRQTSIEVKNPIVIRASFGYLYDAHFAFASNNPANFFRSVSASLCS